MTVYLPRVVVSASVRRSVGGSGCRRCAAEAAACGCPPGFEVGKGGAVVPVQRRADDDLGHRLRRCATRRGPSSVLQSTALLLGLNLFHGAREAGHGRRGQLPKVVDAKVGHITWPGLPGRAPGPHRRAAQSPGWPTRRSISTCAMSAGQRRSSHLRI